MILDIRYLESIIATYNQRRHTSSRWLGMHYKIDQIKFNRHVVKFKKKYTFVIRFECLKTWSKTDNDRNSNEFYYKAIEY